MGTVKGLGMFNVVGRDVKVGFFVNSLGWGIGIVGSDTWLDGA